MAALVLGLCLMFVAEISGQCGTLFAQQAKILNGEPAIPCTVPWHAQVHFVPDNTVASPVLSTATVTCGATILGTEYVAVSPTCLFLYSANVAELLSRFLIVAGDNDLSVFPETSFLRIQQEQIVRPQEIYFQDEYTIRDRATLLSNIDPPNNDFKAYRDYQCAVIKLATPLSFNRCVNNICLPVATDNTCAQKNCIFAGNGLVTDDLSVTPLRSNRTQLTSLTALPLSTCPVLEAMGYSLPSLGGMCARTESTGTPCVNDNGGGLACQRADGSFFLRGIAIPDFCTSGGASLFADAPLCLSFFQEAISGNRAPAS